MDGFDERAQRIANERLHLPAYSYAEAARYAQTTASTVSRWFRGDLQGMRSVFQREPQRGVNYLELIEVYFVANLRRAGLPLDSMRRAYDFLRNIMEHHYPFTYESFKTDGIGIFVEQLGKSDALVDVTRKGQLVARGILEEAVTLLDYDKDIAMRWHLRGRDVPILIDPRISFGRPTIEGVGIPTRTVSQRIHAGDSVNMVVYDFRVTPAQIDEALQFEKDLKSKKSA